MSLFTIGDPHLSFGAEKPMDVFEGWGSYTKNLEDNWRALVTDDDTVVIVGDVSWGMNFTEAAPDFEFIDSLPGQKIILKGNHDYWWTTRKKLEEWKEEKGYKTISFLFNDAYLVGDIAVCGTRSWFYDEAESDNDKVFQRELGRLKMSLDFSKSFECTERIVFLHYPPVYHAQNVPEILEMLKQYGVKRCFYGHIHGKSLGYAFNGYVDDIKFQLVSADYLRFRPYKI